ncbi:MAG: glycosyltransferase family 2 protein [Nitrospinae bacterium]|nr:glycosyltransferase family 2 protein [Nitrospinota bacterium]
MPKVTVYIPAHNYGRFLDVAIQSVLKQTMDDWELIVIDDGSTDDTSEILVPYGTHPKIRIFEQENRGLNITNNIALRIARGEYLMRLDADDFLDENILLVLSHVLDTKPGVGLVYPDYYHVDEDGEIVEIVRRQKIGEEGDLLDLPAHGACTMIRKEVLLEIGGYFEEFDRQDGYGMWLKFIERHHPYNVNLPLFYYRRHGESLSESRGLLMETRRKIKRRVVEEMNLSRKPKVLALVPVVVDAGSDLGNPFTQLKGKPLLERTLEQIQEARSVDRVVVSSNDEEVLAYTQRLEGVEGFIRPEALAKPTARMEDTALHVLRTLEERGYVPDAVCVCCINTPFRRGRHIDKAVDTMTIFGVDSVISITEDLSFFYHHGKNGLTPANGSLQRTLRLERKALFKENGAIFLNRVDTVLAGKFLGERIGHITMLPEESVRINSTYEFWLAEKIAAEWMQSVSSAKLADVQNP